MAGFISDERIAGYVTLILIFRDPFERLVSAYKDKIFGALPGTLHDKMRRKITQRYRGVNIPRVKKLPF